MKAQSYRLTGKLVSKETKVDRYPTREDAREVARDILGGGPLGNDIRIVPSEDAPNITAAECLGLGTGCSITTTSIKEKGCVLATGYQRFGITEVFIMPFDVSKTSFANHIDAADQWVRKYRPGLAVGPMLPGPDGTMIRMAFDPRIERTPTFRVVS